MERAEKLRMLVIAQAAAAVSKPTPGLSDDHMGQAFARYERAHVMQLIVYAFCNRLSATMRRMLLERLGHIVHLEREQQQATNDGQVH